MINRLSEPTLIQMIATIATVEARHSAYLRHLNNLVPFPNELDTPLSPMNVSTTIFQLPYVVSCPQELVLPVCLNGTSLNVTSITNTTSCD